MSKIGKKLITIPEGVKIQVVDGLVKVEGSNGNTDMKVLKGITLKIDGNTLSVVPDNESKQIRSNWGTMRALIQNAVTGAKTDFGKELVIEGIGFRAEVQGTDLVLNLGLSHQVRFPIPIGIKIVTEKNVIKISGHDKAQVGDTAAHIRKLKKPEPYKGKGIHYANETVRRKAGKKAISTSGGGAAKG
ncbi:MAG: 50S ribosomal protein L6 [Patescibacteria group bacterium]|nr:50S ribosomal protein L6 [Patescibacteria group bacterium]MCL5224009.1 50S ribosomal protein L6 [Patescibacteria group bacterium]